MNRILVGAMALALGVVPVAAQSLDDLNIQIHGYATQGFLYTTQNNIFTTSSSNGSPAWTEAVVNVGAQPTPKLRVGVQARYFLLGSEGNNITLDWAAADYKANDKFGVRFGKVKTPSGLLNETQDIDPSYLWSLLPQGIYPLTSRNSLLAHYGGVVYGTLNMGKQLGKLEYRGWGGGRSIGANDGYFVTEKELGVTITNGDNFVTYGEVLHWRTPLAGLMVGVSNFHNNASTNALTDTISPSQYFAGGTFNGTLVSPKGTDQTQYFGRYEKDKLMVAGEYSRNPAQAEFVVPGVIKESDRLDYRSWYAMASYKLTGKLTAGLYDTQFIDHQAALGPARYSKDWVVSGRYDFNQFVYAKAEQHFLDGEAPPSGYDITLNTNLQPSTKLTLLKVGVSF
ncbi:MAG: hypothetical protein ABR923_20250 [Terracidiphilus sp.]|jgi:hypothetical protein